MRVLRIIGKAAVAFYEELFFHTLLGLIHLLSWVVIIPGPFVLTGVYIIGQKSVRGLGVKWRLIWDGIKEFGGRAFLLFLIIVLGYGVVAINIYFYTTPEISPFSEAVGLWVAPIFIFLGLIWTGVAFYAQSFLMELEEPTLLLAIRNSLFLVLLQPFQTLVLLIVAGLSLALSAVLVIPLIIWPGFVASLSLTAVRTMVTHLSEKLEEMEEPEEETEEPEEPEEPEPEGDLNGDRAG